MAAHSLNYERLAKRLLTLPFYGMLLLTCSIFSFNDLLQTIHGHIEQAHVINQMLAKTAARKNTTLISQQVESLLNEHPTIRSIMFFPVDDAEKVNNDPQNLQSYLFSPYLGISEPVVISLANRSKNPSAVNQLIGYMNITLDMHAIRLQWLKHIAPLWLSVLLFSSLPLIMVSGRLKRLTKRLPNVEQLSRKVLENQDIDVLTETEAIGAQGEKQLSIFEKALFHLINRQKMHRHQIDLLSADQMANRDRELKQIQQHSTFQNTITHEFKLSLDRIQSGLQLLQNQYISHEQKDAVDIINLGVEDLNAKLNQIIQMIRIEKGQTTLDLVQFSPTQLITDIIDSFKTEAREKNLLLQAEIRHTDYILEGDVQKISVILTSLIDNAIKFTEDGSVTVISQLQHLEKNIRWTIDVIDTGIGIEDKYLTQIFEPFFQIEPERKHNLKNNNIGLFLAKKMASIVSGELSVSSQVNQGTIFSLSLVLEDWKNTYDRTVLLNKRIDIWYEDAKILDYSGRLTDIGATVEAFSEEPMLLQHLMSERVDALLISYKIDYHQAKSFIKVLREYETNHRVIIIVYYDSKDINLHELESLKVVGADYFADINNVEENLDTHVQKIVEYLD